MDQPPPEATLPPGLRVLKALVIVLMLTMIVGVITVVAVLVTRIPPVFGPAPALPAAVTLPEGLTAEAVTLGRGWIAVVARDAAGGQRIVILAPDGRVRQDVPVGP